jgi:hypothetical protein
MEIQGARVGKSDRKRIPPPELDQWQRLRVVGGIGSGLVGSPCFHPVCVELASEAVAAMGPMSTEDVM